MRFRRLGPDDALRGLRSATTGLDDADAGRRLAEYGPNQIEGIPGTPLPLRLLRQFTHLFALILWVAAGLAFAAERRDPGSGMATLGWAILGVIVVNGVFSFWQEYRAERAIDALRALLPQEARVVRGGSVSALPVLALVPGDVVLLEQGDLVPADCVLLEASSGGVRVNTATLTGESAPVLRDTAPGEVDEPLLAPNVVLAGTSLASGQARGVVYATGMHTEFGRIARLTQGTPEPPSPLQREIARLSRFVAIAATVVGTVCFALGHLLGLPFWGNLTFAIGIIVANVPEGLLPTVTLALAAGGKRMARRNALIRHLPSVETLGAATVICTDKTGTLTMNRMAVRRIYETERFREIPVGSTGATGPVADVARTCHDVKLVRRNGRDELNGDPMELALVEWAGPTPEGREPDRLEEIPFDPDRKRLTVLVRDRAGAGGPTRQRVYVKGALETVLPLCRAVVPAAVRHIQDAQVAMATDGLRVLACGCRDVPAVEGVDLATLEQDLEFAGLIGLEDPPRPEVPEAIRQCQEAGIRVIMTTGDHPSTAVAVGRAIGLLRTPDPVVVRGEELARMSDTQLQLALDAPEILFARLAPDQKVRIVTVLKGKGAVVAATGDGVNDAPALRQADVGIAMGQTGTEVAREAADIVLADDNFASIVAAIGEGRAVFANVRKFLTYILTSNVPELVPFLAFALFSTPLALTVVQILAVDLGTDLLPALALGAERAAPAEMRRPPRSPGIHLLDRPLLLRAYLVLGVLEAIAAMAAFFIFRTTTATLVAIVVMQVANVHVCRSDVESLLRLGPGNRLILWGITGELALLGFVVYTPLGNRLFGTAPVGLDVWLFVLPFALGLVIVDELRKLAGRGFVRMPPYNHREPTAPRN